MREHNAVGPSASPSDAAQPASSRLAGRARQGSPRRGGPHPWILAVLALGAGGCAVQTRTYLTADTASPTGAMTAARHQWAYDGEPVTIELEAPGGPAQYVVFAIDDKDTVVDFPDAAGRYRLTHVFHAGPQPLVSTIYASPYIVQGRRDWIYDGAAGVWNLHPAAEDPPDVESGPERSMQITCYRREVRLRFKERGGPPRRLDLATVRADGGRASVPRQQVPGTGAGYVVVGPDAAGAREVVYTPLYTEVSRAGKTRVELTVEHADGSIERIDQDIDTP